MSLFLGFLLSECNKPLTFVRDPGADSVAINLPRKKLLLISIAGARGAVMKMADIPNIRALLPHSLYSWDAVCDTVSTNQAGWASLFSGVHVAKNGILGGSYTNNNFDLYPTFLYRLKQSGRQLNIVNITSCPSLNDSLIGKSEIDVSLMLNSDNVVKDSVVNCLNTENPDVLVASFRGINDAGISSGFSETSTAYTKAINTVDGYMGKIMHALTNRKNYAQENWMVVITSNHGGDINGKYGGGESSERNTFVLYYNPQFTSKAISAPMVNVPYDGIYPFFYRQDGRDHAAYTNNPAYHFGEEQNFTIEFNIRTTYGGSDDHPVVSNKNWGSGSNTGYAIYKQSGNLRINYKGANASRIDMRNGPPVADGKWHHITVTFDRQNMISFYLDGKFYVSGPSIKDNGTVDAGLPFVVGTDGTLNYSYNGPNGSGDNYISDIRVWNTILSPNTIANWSFQPVTKEHPDYKSLIGWWKATEEPGSTVLRDYSPTGADLTIHNGLRWDTINDVLNPSNIDPTAFVPKSVDIAANVLAWMGVRIDPQWHLDGTIWILE